MKKIFISILLIFLLSSVSYGAASEDVYVRKDVFDAEMRGINYKLDRILEALAEQKQELKSQSQELQNFRQELQAQKQELQTQRQELQTQRQELQAQRQTIQAQGEELKSQSQELQNFRQELQAQRKEIQTNGEELKSLKEEIQSQKSDIAALAQVTAVLSTRVDGVEKRVGDLHNFLYWLLVLFGAILLLPFVNRLWEYKKQPSVTLEDVKRLIAEAKLNTTTQI